MEKEYSKITSDGRIIQDDNKYFKGRELTQVDPELAKNAVRYFTRMFADLEKYVDAYLRVILEQEEGDDRNSRLNQLREEVKGADAIGDFESLIEKIDHSAGLSTDTGQSQKSGKSEEESVSGEPEDETKETEEVAGEREKKKSSADYPESLAELVELVAKAEELSGQSDWQFVQHELDNIRFKWEEILGAADATHASEEGYSELLARREAAEKEFAKRKEQWQEQRRERKRRNLDKRAKIIDQLQDIIDKKRWQAFKEVNKLSNQWEVIKDLPNDNETEEQEKKFKELLKEFNDRKVDFLVKRAQKEEENLVGKLTILEKMDQIVATIGPDTENWEKPDQEMEELSRQWKKIGRVPMEQSDQVWNRFKSIRDEYFKKKMEYNKAFRNLTLKNIRKKTALCEAAEKLLEEEDLAVAVREMNNLHNKWKKIGPIPKDKNDELWERFNEATRKFNDRKSQNLDVIREQEQINYNKKLALCEKAEEFKDRTDWSEASSEMDELMKSWKEIGPVPRKKARKLWNRFKKAMDTFYANRREHYKLVREEHKSNYEEKRKLIAEISKLADADEPEEEVAKVKELQEKFKKIGFVPIKKKSKIEKDYKEVCDRFYQRLRAKGRGASGRRAPAEAVSPDKARRAEFFRLKKECDDLHEEIMKFKDTMTFINPGGKGNALIDEIQQKIDKAEEKFEKKQEKLEELRRNLEE